MYMIKCPCGLAYIGKTQRALKLGLQNTEAACTNEKKKRLQYILIKKGGKKY